MTMPKRSRFRRILKWTGAGTCLSLCAIIVASWHWEFGYTLVLGPSSKDGACDIYDIHFVKSSVRIIEMRLSSDSFNWVSGWYLHVDKPAPNSLVQESRLSLRLPWKLPIFNLLKGWGFAVPLWFPLLLAGLPTLQRIPLWIPLLLTGVPTLLLFRRSRPLPGPLDCRACGYNLTGNVSGKCPECGEPCDAEMSAT